MSLPGKRNRSARVLLLRLGPATGLPSSSGAAFSFPFDRDCFGLPGVLVDPNASRGAVAAAAAATAAADTRSCDDLECVKFRS